MASPPVKNARDGRAAPLHDDTAVRDETDKNDVNEFMIATLSDAEDTIASGGTTAPLYSDEDEAVNIALDGAIDDVALDNVIVVPGERNTCSGGKLTPPALMDGARGGGNEADLSLDHRITAPPIVISEGPPARGCNSGSGSGSGSGTVDTSDDVDAALDEIFGRSTTESVTNPVAPGAVFVISGPPRQQQQQRAAGRSRDDGGANAARAVPRGGTWNQGGVIDDDDEDHRRRHHHPEDMIEIPTAEPVDERQRDEDVREIVRCEVRRLQRDHHRMANNRTEEQRSDGATAEPTAGVVVEIAELEVAEMIAVEGEVRRQVTVLGRDEEGIDHIDPKRDRCRNWCVRHIVVVALALLLAVIASVTVAGLAIKNKFSGDGAVDGPEGTIRDDGDNVATAARDDERGTQAGPSDASSSSSRASRLREDALRDRICADLPGSCRFLSIEGSPQRQSLEWVAADEHYELYPDWRRVQRYALGVVAFGLEGWGDDNATSLDWTRGNPEECSWTWGLDKRDHIMCDDSGRVVQVGFDNNLTSRGRPLPRDVALLGDSLEALQFCCGDFIGTIPTEYGLLKKMKMLAIDNNSLSGPIPSELGKLSRLEAAWLHGNYLTGTMPEPLCDNLKHSELRWLSVDCVKVNCTCCSNCM